MVESPRSGDGWDDWRGGSTVRTLAAFSIVLAFAGCADRPLAGDPGSSVPDVAEIVCEADGSTRVLTPEAVVQADGVHVHLVSRLDEPAEMLGLGRDVDPGETDWVSLTAPGRVDVGCNPFSRHGTGEVPPTTPMEVLDPDGLYVDGELQCSGTVSNMIGDFAEAPLEGRRVPLVKVRTVIRGLDDDDQVFHVGYPEQADPRVAVRRDGQVVATYQFVTFDGDEWIVASNQICASSGLL